MHPPDLAHLRTLPADQLAALPLPLPPAQPAHALLLLAARLELALALVHGGGGKADDVQQQQQQQQAVWDDWQAARAWCSSGCVTAVGCEDAASVNALARRLLALSIALGHPRKALLPLRALTRAWESAVRAARVARGDGPAGGDAAGELTEVAVVFFEACLRTRAFELLAPWLDRPVEGVSRELAALLPTTYPAYTHHLALAALALGRPDDAQDLLAACVGAPAAGAGAVAAGAGRMLALVGVLVHGKPEPLPKHTPLALAKALTAASGKALAYRRAGEALAARARGRGGGEGERLRTGEGLELAGLAGAQAGEDEWEDVLRKDHNHALLVLARRRTLARRVRAAARVFARLTLAELAREVGAPEGEDACEALARALVVMAKNGQLPVTLTPPPPSAAASLGQTVVAFPAPAPDPQLSRRLERLSARAEHVQAWAWAEERRVGLKSRWVGKLAKDASAAAAAGPAGARAAGLAAAAAAAGGDEDVLGAGADEGDAARGTRNTYEDSY